MKSLLVLLTVALAAQAQDASASGSVLEILGPAGLRSEFKSADGTVDGLVQNQPALFGNPMGVGEKQTSGVLVYAAKDDNDGCTEFNSTDTLTWPNATNVIVLVDRGSCYFVDKVQHVQDAHGNAAIVVDNKDEAGIPFMADYNNRGANINIPSILIHKSDGLKLKAFLNKTGASQVTVSMRWNLPHPDNRVEWSLWTSSSDGNDANFKSMFGEAVEAFGKSSLFTPHYFFNKYRGCQSLTDGTASDCHGCTNSGRYCSSSASFTDGGALVSGADIIAEDLRQICVYNTLNETGYEATYKWWTYASTFRTMCALKNNFTKACSEACMKGCELDAAKIDACVTESGGAELDGKVNQLLEKEYDQRLDKGIAFPATVTVNNQPYRGSVNCPKPLSKQTCGIFSMICRGFKNESLIEACNTDAGCPIGHKKNECGDCFGQKIQDACGLCLDKNASSFNKTCAGCDGVPNSKATKDQCGICNGPGVDDCGKCYNDPKDPRRITNGTAACKAAEEAGAENAAVAKSSQFPVWAVVLIVLGCVVVVAGGVFYFMKRREEAMREDIDKLLAQYINLDGAAPMN